MLREEGMCRFCGKISKIKLGNLTQDNISGAFIEFLKLS